MSNSHWWIQSGEAAQAARDLVWFVVVLFVVIGVGMWRTHKREEKRSDRKRGE